jgi:hypothetical protein
MPGPKIDLREAVKDIKTGLDDTALMEKYRFSARELLSLFNKLIKSGILKQSELDARVSSFEKTVDLALQSDWISESDMRRPAPDKVSVLEAKPGRLAEAPAAPLPPKKAPASQDAKDSLINAAKKGDLSDVRNLLEMGLQVDTRAQWGMTPLMWAASKGHINVVKFLLMRKAEVNAVSTNNSTALMWAAFAGHVEIVRILLEHGADVNMKSHQGKNALMAACHNGHAGVAELLMRYGATIGMKDNEGKTAIVHATEKGHKAIRNLIIKHMSQMP